MFFVKYIYIYKGWIKMGTALKVEARKRKDNK